MRPTLLLLAFLAAPVLADEPPVREWALVYVMSYDNNLEGCAQTILRALAKGTESNDLAVTVLADFTDEEGLVRYTVRKGAGEGERLATDDSASEEVLASYLEWALESVPAKHYAVVFLDHGGDLDDMCYDERPGGGSEKRWLSARAVGPILRAWREKVRSAKPKGEVELLFLQQCGRGSIDNLYNFRGAADAIMGSQTTVGAPNTYYTAMGLWLADHPRASGLELAREIMEADEHYTNYVCVAGLRLSELPKRIDPVVEELLRSDLVAPEDAALTFGGWQRGGETNYDLLDYVSSLYEASSIPEGRRAALTRFRTWLEKDLILAHSKRPGTEEKTARWTGLSVFVPVSRRVRGRHADYPLYEDSRLDELWAKIYPSGGS